ncbi:hypothetical protein C2S52_009580 [Perilla frutescens var. hirtella]|nr:hypothetical protein C2S52_009580 [Perilla frutescens var. hirtella]
MQIQAVGLQVVKVQLQKGIGAESDPFLIFYFGELVEDLFIILQNILENPINREAVAIAGECLKLVMLLQTLSKECDYEKGLMHLLLEFVLMIFLTSDGSLSQEANDLQTIAVKLVSQLAQTPSSAASIRDVLMEMPATRRQQLQDIIRASVVQDKNPQPMTSTGPPLVIKLPSQTEPIGVKISLPVALPAESNDSSVEEEDEDDDWDTFHGEDEKGHSAFMTPSDEENLKIDDHECDEAASMTDTAEVNNQTEDCDRPEDGVSNHQQSTEVSPVADEELLPNIQSDQIWDEHIDPLAASLVRHPVSSLPNIDKDISVVSPNDSEETSAVDKEPSSNMYELSSLSTDSTTSTEK